MSILAVESTNTPRVANVSDTTIFMYRGCRFNCMVLPTGAGLFLARVEYLDGLPGMERSALAQDADPYATAAEAMRHAQQQAMRWVNDRTGDGQGQF